MTVHQHPKRPTSNSRLSRGERNVQRSSVSQLKRQNTSYGTRRWRIPKPYKAKKLLGGLVILLLIFAGTQIYEGTFDLIDFLKLSGVLAALSVVSWLLYVLVCIPLDPTFSWIERALSGPRRRKRF